MFKFAEVSGLSLMQGRRCLRWQVVEHVCTGSKGVGAMRDHGSRDMGAGRESLGPQISQHGVGPPASERGDGIVVHPGTKQGRSATRPKAFDGDEIRGNPCLRLDDASTEAQTISNFRVADELPPGKWEDNSVRRWVLLAQRRGLGDDALSMPWSGQDRGVGRGKHVE